MPFAHFESIIGVMNGELWISGGNTYDWATGYNALSYLDKETNKWFTYTLDALDRQLKFHRWITVSDNEAFIMGGWDLTPGNVGYTDEVLLFNTDSGQLY